MFNKQILQKFDINKFKKNAPFPHFNFDGFLEQPYFDELYTKYPPLSLFAKEDPSNRDYGQRPHRRYYMYYEQIKSSGLGRIELNKLPKIWQEFIGLIYSNKEYQKFIKNCFGCAKLRIRIDWHSTPNGMDVSPHKDSVGKLGTHLFYFNTKENWKEEWGGEILCLGGLKSEKENPEINEFNIIKKYPILDNKSLLFQRTNKSWHAVDVIKCPEDYYRRLCSIVFLKK